MKNLLTILLFWVFITNTTGQFYGTQYNSKEATNGYSLFSTFNGTYLVDNCGGIVNKWNVTQADNHCKLLPNGNLLYMRNNIINELDWKGQSITNVVAKANDFYLDYEVIKLPNGNYLCVGRQTFSLSQFQEYGYDIPGTSPSVSDIVVEVDKSNGNIVWRWNLIDHVIQDKSSAKKSFGVLKDHPEKININAIATYDWQQQESFMINGMDYNVDLDQIVLSVRKIGEIVIIDHSTTTAQAKSSSGGKYGKGGDLLYRFGNPYNYGRGTKSDQHLFFQHNPNWIQYGPHKGKIIMFNNLLSSKNYSSVDIINPPINADGSYKLETGKAFLPLKPEIEYNTIKSNTNIYSGYTSCAKVLPNGNIAITTGQNSTAIEIDAAGKKIWEYIVQNGGYIFRTERYPADYPGFAGKTLKPNGNAESPPTSYQCKLYNTTDNVEENIVDLRIVINNDQIEIIGIEEFDYALIGIDGKLLAKGYSEDGTININKQQSINFYVLKIKNDKLEKSFKIIF